MAESGVDGALEWGEWGDWGEGGLEGGREGGGLRCRGSSFQCVDPTGASNPEPSGCPAAGRWLSPGGCCPLVEGGCPVAGPACARGVCCGHSSGCPCPAAAPPPPPPAQPPAQVVELRPLNAATKGRCGAQCPWGQRDPLSRAFVRLRRRTRPAQSPLQVRRNGAASRLSAVPPSLCARVCVWACHDGLTPVHMRVPSGAPTAGPDPGERSWHERVCVGPRWPPLRVYTR